MFNSKKIKELESKIDEYRKMCFDRIKELDSIYKSIAYLKEEKSKLEEELNLWKEKYADLLNKNIEIMERISLARGDTE